MKGFGRSAFTFERAEQLFKETFGEDELRNCGFSFFDHNGNNEDMFFSDPLFQMNQRNRKMLPNGNRGSNQQHNSNHQQLAPRHNFDRDDGFGSLMPRSFFDNDDEDDFFGFGHARKMMQQMENMMNQQMSMFGQMQSDMNTGNLGGQGVQTQCFQSSTIIKNGKKVQVSKNDIIDRSGQRFSEVHEKVQDGNRVLKDERYNPHQGIGYGNQAQTRQQISYGNDQPYIPPRQEQRYQPQTTYQQVSPQGLSYNQQFQQRQQQQ